MGRIVASSAHKGLTGNHLKFIGVWLKIRLTDKKNCYSKSVSKYCKRGIPFNTIKFY